MFFVFNFLLNLNKIAIFYIKSDKKTNLLVNENITHKNTLRVFKFNEFNSELKQTKGIRLFNKNKAL